jgi:antitoxin ParD1/3/4
VSDYLFPADLQPYVDEMLASGRYAHVSQLIAEAVQLHRDHEMIRRQKLEHLRREIQLGLEASARGEVVDGPEYFDQLLSRLDAEKREAS